MRRSRLFLCLSLDLLSLALLSLVLAACSAGTQQSRPVDVAPARPLLSGAGLPALPALAQLSARQTAAGPGGFLRSEGNDFLPLEAHANLLESGSGSSGEFSPAYSPGGPLSGLAYGVYLLDSTGYAGPNFYVLDWDSAPAADTAYVALANFELGRWEWYALPANNIVSPGAAAFDDTYRDANGYTYIAVVVSGAAAASLDYVRLGDNLPPLPALSADPPAGSTADSFTLDASASFDPDGEVANYSFFANNQTFDNGINPVLQNVTFTDPGDQFCVVTVTDDDGQQEQANVTIPVAPGPIAVLEVSSPRIDLSETINFDAGLSEAGTGTITKYEFDPEGDGSFIDNGMTDALNGFSYSAAGIFNATVRVTNDSNETDTAIIVVRVDWRHSYTDSGIRQIIALPDGSCFLCGTTYLGATEGTDGLVMRLDPQGGIVWKRRLYTSMFGASDVVHGIALGSGGDLYALADIGRVSGNFLLLLQLDPADGGLAFSKFLDPGAGTSLDAVGGYAGLVADSQGDLHIAGEFNGPNRNEILLFRCSADGSFEQSERWSENDAPDGRFFGGLAIDSSDQLYLSSHSSLESAGALRVNLLSLDRDHAERWDRVLSVSYGSEELYGYAQGICVSGGALYLSGECSGINSGLTYPLLLKAGTDGSLGWLRVPELQLGDLYSGFGPCAGDGSGGVLCGGYAQGAAGTLASLFRFNADGSLPLSKHYGLAGEYDDSSDCAPVSGPGGALYLGSQCDSQGVVFNDYVYSFITPEAFDWATPALAQDIDANSSSSNVLSVDFTDFSFTGTDSGGGFVSRYHP